MAKIGMSTPNAMELGKNSRYTVSNIGLKYWTSQTADTLAKKAYIMLGFKQKSLIKQRIFDHFKTKLEEYFIIKFTVQPI